MRLGNEIMMMRAPICTALVLFAVAHPAIAQSHPDLGELSAFPIGDKVWLASVVGEVTVNPEFPIKSGVFGELEWIAADGAEVKEDDVLCRTAAENIRLSARQLALNRSRHPNALIDLEWSYHEKRKSAETAVAEVVKKLSDMDLTPTERELLGNDFAKRLEGEKANLEEELERLSAKLEGEYFTRGLEDEKAALELEIDNKRQSHAEMMRSSELRAEVDGTLSVKLSNVIKPEAVIGIITKIGTAEAMLEISDPRLSNVPPAQLSVRIPGDDGRIYEGRYLRTLEEKSFQRNAPIHVFGIGESGDGTAVPVSLSGRRLFEVSRVLDNPGHIVPKGDLLFKFPEEINKGGWVAFIGKRWGGVHLAYVGPRELVIRKRDEN